MTLCTWDGTWIPTTIKNGRSEVDAYSHMEESLCLVDLGADLGHLRSQVMGRWGLDTYSHTAGPFWKLDGWALHLGHLRPRGMVDDPCAPPMAHTPSTTTAT
jgi:hypothetical protein